MNRLRPLLVSTVLILLFLGNSGCIFSPGPPSDDSFLKPIPEATLQAFQFGTPIETRLQAVIAARREIGASVEKYSDIPQVVSVEEMKYVQAISRLGEIVSRVDESHPESQKVWMVVFLCEVHLTPPTPDQTPLASQSCTFVILNQQDGHALLQGNNPDCKSLYEW